MPFRVTLNAPTDEPSYFIQKKSIKPELDERVGGETRCLCIFISGEGESRTGHARSLLSALLLVEFGGASAQGKELSPRRAGFCGGDPGFREEEFSIFVI